MPARRTSRESGPPAGAEVTSPSNSFGLVRYAHIFSSAVREILESTLLRETSSLPLTLPQFHLLKLMAINGKHQVGEVAHFLGVSAPAATKNIDKLEGLGLVVRSPQEGDRRATLLSVSEKGRKLVRKYEELKISKLAPVLQGFTEEELRQLTSLLRRFAISLYETEGPGNGACLRCSAYIEPGCPVGHVRGGCPYQSARKSDEVPLEGREPN